MAMDPGAKPALLLVSRRIPEKFPSSWKSVSFLWKSTDVYVTGHED